MFIKSKTLAGVLCISVLLSSAGCRSYGKIEFQSQAAAETAGLSEPEQKEYKEGGGFYEELIAAARECVLTRDETILADYDFSSALLTTGSYETLGYLAEDIDGDGIDELIFGENGTETDSEWGGIIYDIYTVSDGELVHVLNGWERNRYYLCENGMIANEGSSGAANSSYSYFTVESSALRLVESVIYDGTRDAGNPWFYSTESEDDAENAESISEEKAAEIRDKYVYKHPVFIPFVEEH